MTAIKNYIYRPAVKARKFNAYPIELQNIRFAKVASDICVQLGEIDGKRRRGKPSSLKVVSHIIGNYARAVKRYPDAPHHYHFHYSRNEANLREDVTGFTPKLIEIIDLLAARGFIENEIASRSFGASGRESTFHYNPEFEYLMKAVLTDGGSDPNLAIELPKLEPVEFNGPILRYRENLPNRTKEQNRSAKSQELEAVTRDQKRMLSVLTRYNKMLYKTGLDFDMETLERAFGGLPRDFDPEHVSEPRAVFRLFSDKEMKTHGRFYGGVWMNLASSYRPYLLIDGQPTIELDFQGMQPKMLFALKGEQPPFTDPYEVVEGNLNPYMRPDQYRRLIKEAFMYLFNSRTKPENFVRLLNAKKLNEFMAQIADSSPYDIEDTIEANRELYEARLLFDDKVFREHLYNDIRRAWAPIWEYFEDKSFNWRQLTKIESDIAHEVIKETTKEGIVVLPIHDAFIATEKDASIIKASMIKAFMKILDTSEQFVPDIKEK